ncbi:MAG: hypothetical protein ABSE72_03850 [Bacteroidales bacterium]
MKNPIFSDTVGPHTVLHKCANLSFGIDQKQPNQRIEHQEYQPDNG